MLPLILMLNLTLILTRTLLLTLIADADCRRCR